MSILPYFDYHDFLIFIHHCRNQERLDKSNIEILREHHEIRIWECPLFCGLFIIRTTFGFRWVGGLRTDGCSNWRRGKKYTPRKCLFCCIKASKSNQKSSRITYQSWGANRLTDTLIRYFKIESIFQGVRIYLSTMFKLDGGCVGQNRIWTLFELQKAHKIMDAP